MTFRCFPAACFALVAVFGLSLGTGCAETAQIGGAAQAPRWETRKLANGVELRVSDEAGVDARKVVEEIESEMRSRYIGAR